MTNLNTNSGYIGKVQKATSVTIGYKSRVRTYNEIKVDMVIRELVENKKFNKYSSRVEKRLVNKYSKALLTE